MSIIYAPQGIQTPAQYKFQLAILDLVNLLTSELPGEDALRNEFGRKRAKLLGPRLRKPNTPLIMK